MRANSGQSQSCRRDVRLLHTVKLQGIRCVWLRGFGLICG